MKLSVLIPVYNEAKTLSDVIKSVSSVDIDKEIIIVDDGSTDGSKDLLDTRYKGAPGIKILFHEANMGKGAAIKTALKHATGDIIIIQDADLEYNTNDYLKLVKPIEDKRASVVYGSRFVYVHRWLWMWHWFQNRFLGKHYEIRYLSHFLAILSFNFLIRILYNANITDEATCYKVFRADIIKSINLKATGFEFCPEITAKVLKLGHKIYEVPIRYHPRTLEEGKKIRWTDGVYALWVLIKYRFVD
ncbi:MAG: glycosyltransferase family 2 protein [Candidatus Omnitrophica bacterium]|nr:glycosyltransferase family 2 protein [Candidatus Omnitrophota bacterium]